VPLPPVARCTRNTCDRIAAFSPVGDPAYTVNGSTTKGNNCHLPTRTNAWKMQYPGAVRPAGSDPSWTRPNPCSLRA